MFRFLNIIYKGILYVLFLFTTIIIFLQLTVGNLGDAIETNYDFIVKLTTNIEFIFIFSLVYVIITTFGTLSLLFKKPKTITIKLPTGKINIKVSTLSDFVIDYLLRHELVKKAKVKVIKKYQKINLEVVVYSYNLDEISIKLLDLQEELKKEIHKKLLLKVSNINIVIANLGKSNNVSKKIEKEEDKYEDIEYEKNKMEEEIEVINEENENSL